MTDASFADGVAIDRATPETRPHVSGYIPGLDGIRAVCISMVMVAHYGFGNIVPGGLGVTIFFFLSGFLITGLLLKEVDTTGTVSLVNFYTRRFLRLAPELMLLIIVCSTIGLFFKPVHWYDLLASVTYTNNYVGMYNEVYQMGPMRWPHLWSLAVEEHFYLTFPIVVMILGKKPKALLSLLVILCVVALVWRLHIVENGAPFGFLQSNTEHPYTYCATDARFDSIVYGCIIAVLFKVSQFRPKGMAAWLFLVLSVFLFLVSLAIRDESFRESYRYSLQGLAMMAAFYGLFGSSTEVFTKILETSLMRRLGVLSYGAYLWHLEPLRLYEGYIGESIHSAVISHKLFINIIGFVVTFAFAQLSYSVTMKIRDMRAKFHVKAV